MRITVLQFSLQQACGTQHTLHGSQKALPQLRLLLSLQRLPLLPQLPLVLLLRLLALRLTITLLLAPVLVEFRSLPNSLRLERKSFWSRRDRHLQVAGVVRSNPHGCLAQTSRALMCQVSATRFGLTRMASLAGTHHRWPAASWAEALRSMLGFGGSPTLPTLTRTSHLDGGRVT